MGNRNLGEDDIRRATMQELAKVAKLYYENNTKEIKDYFKKLDANGDGVVCIHELESYFSSMKSGGITAQDVFKLLVRDGSQYLYLEECTTLCYLVATKPVCNICRRFILGNGFKCIKCFKAGITSVVCVTCFEPPSGQWNHPKTDFKDVNTINACNYVSKPVENGRYALRFLFYVAKGTGLVMGLMGVPVPTTFAAAIDALSFIKDKRIVV